MIQGELTSQSIDRNQLLRNTVQRMEYPSFDDVSEEMLARIESFITAKLPAMHCRYIYEITSFQNCKNGVILASDSNKSLKIESKKWAYLTSLTGGVSHVCCFALTLGHGLDDEIALLKESSLMDAYMLDALGSAMADLSADHVALEVRRRFEEKGLETSTRFSPGYCDWPLISGQKEMFGFLDTPLIELHMLPQGIMKPRKSITAAIIAAKVIPHDSPCIFCKRDCAHRRTEFNNSATEKN